MLEDLNELGEDYIVSLMKICYLFIYADGEASPSELKNIKMIRKQSNIPDYYADQFKEFCDEVKPKISGGNTDIIIEEINNVIDGGFRQFFRFFEDSDNKKIKQAHTIWTLINLGYADKEYSESEKKIVNYLIDKWKVDPVLAAEFNDIAETIMALRMKRDRIEASLQPEEKNKAAEKEMKAIGKEIRAMYEDARTCILQAYILLNEETQNDHDEEYNEDEEEYEDDDEYDEDEDDENYEDDEDDEYDEYDEDEDDEDDEYDEDDEDEDEGQPSIWWGSK